MKIIVLGAYGYTGRLICQELIKENIDFAIGGRKQAALDQLKQELAKELESEIIELTEAQFITKVISEYDVFINCVGPFTETADLLLGQVANAGKFYIDITGELGFVENSRTRFHNTAEENKSTILHSCAFESVLVNLLSHRIMKDIDSVKSVFSYYNTGRSKASPGTKLTMKLSKFRENYHYRQGKKTLIENIEVQDVSSSQNKSLSALAFSLPEICFAKWDSTARNIGSFLIMDTYDASYASRNSQRQTTKDDKKIIIEKFNNRRPLGPNNEMRKNQTYVIEVRVEDSMGRWRSIVLKGKDYYLLSARILVYILKEFLNQSSAPKYGVISPAQFLGESHTFFEDLNLRPDEK